jgi:hypothetical protein
VRPPGGARVIVHGDLPVNAGCASSSALTVAFLRALLAFAGPGAAALAEPRRLADLAWRAEVVRPGGPGGKMDPLTSALGGLVHLSFGPTPFVQKLPARLDGFVLIEGGEPKDTTGVLAATRRDVEVAAELLALDAGLDLAAVCSTGRGRCCRRQGDAPERAARTEELVFATLYSRDRCTRRCASSPSRSRPGSVGELLDEHHARLRDALAPRRRGSRRCARGAAAGGARRRTVRAAGASAYAPGRGGGDRGRAPLGARPRRDGERRVGHSAEAAPRVLRVEAVAESRLPRASSRIARRPARRTSVPIRRCRSFVTRRRLSSELPELKAGGKTLCRARGQVVVLRRSGRSRRRPAADGRRAPSGGARRSATRRAPQLDPLDQLLELSAFGRFGSARPRDGRGEVAPDLGRRAQRDVGRECGPLGAAREAGQSGPRREEARHVVLDAVDHEAAGARAAEEREPHRLPGRRPARGVEHAARSSSRRARRLRSRARRLPPQRIQEFERL